MLRSKWILIVLKPINSLHRPQLLYSWLLYHIWLTVRLFFLTLVCCCFVCYLEPGFLSLLSFIWTWLRPLVSQTLLLLSLAVFYLIMLVAPSLSLPPPFPPPPPTEAVLIWSCLWCCRSIMLPLVNLDPGGARSYSWLRVATCPGAGSAQNPRELF